MTFKAHLLLERNMTGHITASPTAHPTDPAWTKPIGIIFRSLLNLFHNNNCRLMQPTHPWHHGTQREATDLGIWSPKSEIVPQELHDKSAVLVWLFSQSVQLSNGFLKCLQTRKISNHTSMEPTFLYWPSVLEAACRSPLHEYSPKTNGIRRKTKD